MSLARPFLQLPNSSPCINGVESAGNPSAPTSSVVWRTPGGFSQGGLEYVVGRVRLTLKAAAVDGLMKPHNSAMCLPMHGRASA